MFLRRTFGCEALEPRTLLAANPIINEFVADNAAGLADEDGDHSDWVEIFNAGDAAVDLSGWHLTDNDAELEKWTFPSKNLQPGEFLLVFASSKNRPGTGPLGELHTNFRLDSQGEYLALVRPDMSVASQFAPNYPRQLEDISFGTSMTPVTFVAENHPVEYLVPTSDAMEPAWRQAGFSHPSLVTGVPANASTLVVTEAGTGTIDFVEIQNVSGAAVNTTGWKVVVNQADNLALPSYSSLVTTDPGVVSYWRLNEDVGAQGGLAHGQALINRDGPDSFHGVTVYDTPLPNGGIGMTGRVATWRFFNDTPGTNGRLITPLLLEDVGVDQYMVRGIGTTRTVSEAGLQSWDFAVAQGTDTFDWTAGRFHMGVRYGSPTVSNPGVVEFGGGANGWDFFGSAAGAPNVVLNTQITGAQSFNNLGRDYSVQFTAVPTSGGPTITADDAVGANDGQYSASGLSGLQPGAIVGDSDKAMNFAGGELTVPASASLSFGGSAMTVEAWVQVDTLGAARWIVAKDDGDAAATPGLDYALGITAAGEFRFVTQGLSQGVTANVPIGASAAAWHHVVGVQDPASGTIRLYVDGQLRGSAPLVTTGVTAVSGLKIGDRSGLGGGQNFDGRIDEVAIYGRALSQSDVATHFLSGVDARTGGVARSLPIVWELPSSVAAGEVLFRNDQPGADFFGADLPWSNGGPGWAIVLDAANQPVDFAAWGYSQAQLQGLTIHVGGQPVAVGAHWAGGGAASLGSDATSLSRQGNQDRNQSLDFVWQNASAGASNAGLTTPFQVELLPLRGGIGYARSDAGAGQGETVGPPVIDRAVTDGASGSIFLLDNFPFTQIGRVTQWSMYSTNTLRITPLILRQNGGSYEITGIGTTRLSTAAGLQTYDFALQSGSDLVQPGIYYFGFKDGDNAIDNTGVIDWDDGTADRIRWFGGGRAGSMVAGGNVGGGQTFSRTYSLRATTSVPLANEVEVNVESQLYNQRTSLYVRYPFTADNPADIDTLSLLARYDDGFVAYLNGTEIARRNVPATTTFASTASINRPVGQVTVFDQINVTAMRHLLVAGPNLLAIHAFNDALDSSEFFIDAQLAGAGLGTPPTLGYLTTPTPGAVNGVGQTGYVGDTQFDRDRGFYTAPFIVAITTPQTPDADIYYTTDGTEPAPTNTAAARYTAPIPINRTTVLRAAGFKTGYIASNVDTHTYVFVADVMQQSVISPAIRNHAVWGPQLDDSLLEIPSVSVVIPGTSGIPIPETAMSIELMFPDGTPGFQANAGVERSGSTSLAYQKNSMRVSFKRLYGPAMLDFNPFGEGAASQYDQLLLRSSHDSINYTHNNGTRGVYLRNRWINDRQREMGSPAPHSRPVHVYLNGTYWGVYDLMERPDGAFMASYSGGDKDDYDALNSGEAINGDSMAFTATMAATGNLAALEQYIDLTSYADYMLTQFYGGNDWDWNHFQNWGAARKREAGAKWAWFHWDSDMILRTTPTANVVDRGGPGNMWGAIKQHAAFRQILADRDQRLFFNDGILTPARVLASLNALADEFDVPIIAESARWGGGGFTPDTWRQQFDQMIAQWVATRTQTVIDQMRAAGVFPALGAPVFAIDGAPQYGGPIDAGAQLSMSATGTTTVNTIDLVRTADPVFAFVPADNSLDDDWSSRTYSQGAHGETWLSGTNGVGYDTVTASGPNYLPLIGLNMQAQMSGAGRNTSAYVRVPFNIADQATIDSMTALRLRLLYDDGYVTFLNGTEVAFGNAPGRGGFPGVLAWNSRSPTSLDAILAAPTVVDLTSRRNLLRVGENVLAIHGLNGNNTSSDFLVRPELFAEAAGMPPVPPTIFYTLDGRDPQAPGAPTYAAPVSLAATTLIKARAFQQGQWSALSEALYTVSVPPVRVTEIMYNPRSAGSGETFGDKDQYEFLEIQNVSSTQTVDLAGFHFSDGITFTFGATALPPGDRVVIAANEAAFRERYGPRIAIAGVYTGNLSNAGEHVALVGPLGEPVQDFTYGDAWYPETDGGGRSLVTISPMADANAASAWRPSHEIDGSPAEKDLIQGDANEDDRVDARDASILQAHLGTAVGAVRTSGDFNGDGAVTRLDAAILTQNYSRFYLPPASAPAANIASSASTRARFTAAAVITARSSRQLPDRNGEASTTAAISRPLETNVARRPNGRASRTSGPAPLSTLAIDEVMQRIAVARP